MKIQKNEKEILITKKLKKGETYRIAKGKKFESVSFFKKTQTVKGIASYCSDGKHVLFIDYDDVPLWLVEQDYKRLQEQFNIPKGYLFTTKKVEEFGNFHVICLAKFNPKEIYEMISITHADVNYASMPLRNKYRNWILRVGKKRRKDRPMFLSIIGEPSNNDFKLSLAHLNVLNNLYELPEIKWENLDGLQEIFFQEYEAS